ncbi:hypothetical protein CBOM_03417 [Ceraceosorus bombacis]|uniref:Uncharacterized protein n=1 Tax=Ceraceosorus bombacis TaxID=401625 RepID=A0A0P1BN12_9BASI|nr:hypothetical protein CBOM_03417 [Ceraceosorus bombacis]
MILLAAPVTILCCTLLYLMVSTGSSRQIASLYEFNEGLSNMNEAEFELESDEYEYEEDSDAEPSNGKRPLRRAYKFGSNDSVIRRRSSQVRITSNDPRSRLCISPIHLDLDERGRSGAMTLGSMHRENASPHQRGRRESGRLDPSAAAQALARSPNGESPSTGGDNSATSSRRSSVYGTDDGSSTTFAAAAAAAALGVPPASHAPLQTSAASAEVPTPSSTGSERPPRLRPVASDGSVKGNALTTPALLNDSNLDEPRSSDESGPLSPDLLSPSSSAAGSFASLSDVSSVSLSGDERSRPSSSTGHGGASSRGHGRRRPAPAGPPPILKREPEIYAGLPLVRSPAEAGLYPNSQGSFSADWDRDSLRDSPPGFPGRGTDTGPWPFEGSSSAAAYLDNEAQNTRSPFENSQWSTSNSSLPPGAGFGEAAPRPPPLPRLGSMTLAQIRSAWPTSRRNKHIRLTEPDWTAFADCHDRAKERLETASHVASHPDPRSLWYVGPRDGEHAHWAADDGATLQDPRAWEKHEFWFERFTQSTAAAGRDWDWRKRRARRQAQRAKELGSSASTTSLPSDLPTDSLQPPAPRSAEASTAAIDKPLPSAPTRSSSAPVISSPSPPRKPSHHVGLTDVQLQLQRQAHSERVSKIRSPPASPLISFDEAEKSSLPSMKIGQTGEAIGFGDEEDDGGDASSPLGRALKSLRSGSFTGSQTSSPTRAEFAFAGDVDAMEQSAKQSALASRAPFMDRNASLPKPKRSRASLPPVGISPPVMPKSESDLSGRSKIRNSMRKALRKPMPDPFAPLALMDATEAQGAPRRPRRASDADRTRPSVEVPSPTGRWSSLTPRQRLDSLRNLKAKPNRPPPSAVAPIPAQDTSTESSSLEAVADPSTAWLLAEADRIGDDSDDNVPLAKSLSRQSKHSASPLIPERELAISTRPLPKSGSLRGALALPSNSPATPSTPDAAPWADLGFATTIERRGPLQQMWSSADAYGLRAGTDYGQDSMDDYDTSAQPIAKSARQSRRFSGQAVMAPGGAVTIGSMASAEKVSSPLKKEPKNPPVAKVVTRGTRSGSLRRLDSAGADSNNTSIDNQSTA